MIGSMYIISQSLSPVATAVTLTAVIE